MNEPIDNFTPYKNLYSDLEKNIDNLLIGEKEIKGFESNQIGMSIKPPSAFLSDLEKEFDSSQIDRNPTLPWQKTHSIFRFRPGEFTIWAGRKANKKTMVTYQSTLSMAAQGLTSVIASMEFKPHKSLKRLVVQAFGNHQVPIKAIRQFMQWIEGKIWFYDQQHTVKPKDIIQMSKYCSEALGINNILIDSLMKCGMAVDDSTAQKFLINELIAINAYNGNHGHLVCHLKKPAMGNYNAIPVVDDISGGADIYNQVDNVLLCWTDKQKKAELLKPEGVQDPEIIQRPCQKLIVGAQREDGFEGPINLWFNSNSLTFRESQSSQPVTYHKYFMEQ